MAQNKTRVQVRGTIGKSVRIPSETASTGATIGVDLKYNGSVLTLAQLAALLQTGAATQDSPGNINPGTGGNPVNTVIWQNIQYVPPQVVNPGRYVAQEEDVGEDRYPMSIPGPAGSRGLQGFPGLPTDDPEDPIQVPGPTGATGATGATGSAGSAGAAGAPGAAIFLSAEDPDDVLHIPGQQGAAGATGPSGGAGPQGLPVWFTADDPEDYLPMPGQIPGPRGPAGLPAVFYPDDVEDPLSIPGPAGAVGATGSTGSTGATGVAGPAIFLSAEDPDDVLHIPGQQGATGSTGAAGSTGPAGASGAFWFASDDPEDPLYFLGPAGPAGATGATGSAGAAGPIGASFWFSTDDPEDPLSIPGLTGLTGATGPTGLTGAAGPIGASFWFASDDPEDPLSIPGLMGATGAAGSPGAQGGLGVPFFWSEDPDDSYSWQPSGLVSGLIAGGVTLTSSSTNSNYPLLFGINATTPGYENNAITFNPSSGTLIVNPGSANGPVTIASGYVSAQGATGVQGILAVADGNTGNRQYQLRSGAIATGTFDLFDATSSVSIFQVSSGHVVTFNEGPILNAAAVTAAAGQVAIGNGTGTTAITTTGGVTLPALAKGYWTINISGTNYAIPYYTI